MSPAARSDGRVGAEIHALISELYPICRSITGDGLRQTLGILNRIAPLQVKEVPTGTRVFDWTVPPEWNIRAASIRSPAGERIIDFAASNLHVVSYSTPVRARMTLDQLRPHLYALPEHPDWIPYRTSYYRREWGFCLSQRTLESMSDGEYDVEIDSSLEDGSMSYGELFLQGDSDDEVLISAHACHPSMCNDNLSGVAVAAFLARHLGRTPHRLSYRFLFIPGTIGAIAWLALNEDRLSSVKHGLVLACLGDRGGKTYKRSRRGNALIDRAAAHVLAHDGGDFSVRDFQPYGYDERQYCSPGINLAVGSLSRTPWGEFAEYHTSADDPSFVQPGPLQDSYEACLEIFQVLEQDAFYLNTNPKGEPRLGDRGLYRTSVDGGGANEFNLSVLWTLNLSDGEHSLLDIAERAGMRFALIREAASRLEATGLLRHMGE